MVALLRVHPRVCGGNLDTGLQSCLRSGTSPRVRGKRAPGAQQQSGKGYIPACAGETRHLTVSGLLSSPPGDSFARVHPRVCGGNSYIGYTNVETYLDLQFGSSRLTTYSPSYSIKSLVGSPSIDTLWRVGAFGEAHVMTTAPWE